MKSKFERCSGDTLWSVVFNNKIGA